MASDVELAPWLVAGANRITVMHISTSCKDASVWYAAAVHGAPL